MMDPAAENQDTESRHELETQVKTITGELETSAEEARQEVGAQAEAQRKLVAQQKGSLNEQLVALKGQIRQLKALAQRRRDLISYTRSEDNTDEQLKLLETQAKQIDAELSGISREIDLAELEAMGDIGKQITDKKAELEKAYQEGLASIEEFESKHTKLDNGDWVVNEDFNTLPPEYQEKLKKLGVEGYNAFIQQEQRDFEASNVRLSNGDWVAYSDWNRLGETEKAKLNELGIEGFNVWVQEENARREAEYQSQLAELRKDYVEAGDGNWVDRDWFYRQSVTAQAVIMGQGVDAYNQYIDSLNLHNLQMIQDITNGKIEATAKLLEKYDYNKDGVIDSFDLVAYRNIMAGHAPLGEPLPIKDPETGKVQYISPQDWRALSPIDQAKLQEIGSVEKFKNWLSASREVQSWKDYMLTNPVYLAAIIDDEMYNDETFRNEISSILGIEIGKDRFFLQNKMGNLEELKRIEETILSTGSPQMAGILYQKFERGVAAEQGRIEIAKDIVMPGRFLVLHWDELNPYEKGFYIAADVLFVASLGWGALAKVGSTGVRTFATLDKGLVSVNKVSGLIKELDTAIRGVSLETKLTKVPSLSKIDKIATEIIRVGDTLISRGVAGGHDLVQFGRGIKADLGIISKNIASPQAKELLENLRLKTLKYDSVYVRAGETIESAKEVGRAWNTWVKAQRNLSGAVSQSQDTTRIAKLSSEAQVASQNYTKSLEKFLTNFHNLREATPQQWAKIMKQMKWPEFKASIEEISAIQKEIEKVIKNARLLEADYFDTIRELNELLRIPLDKLTRVQKLRIVALRQKLALDIKVGGVLRAEATHPYLREMSKLTGLENKLDTAIGHYQEILKSRVVLSAEKGKVGATALSKEAAEHLVEMARREEQMAKGVRAKIATHGLSREEFEQFTKGLTQSEKEAISASTGTRQQILEQIRQLREGKAPAKGLSPEDLAQLQKDIDRIRETRLLEKIAKDGAGALSADELDSVLNIIQRVEAQVAGKATRLAEQKIRELVGRAIKEESEVADLLARRGLARIVGGDPSQGLENLLLQALYLPYIVQVIITSIEQNAKLLPQQEQETLARNISSGIVQVQLLRGVAESLGAMTKEGMQTGTMTTLEATTQGALLTQLGISTGVATELESEAIEAIKSIAARAVATAQPVMREFIRDINRTKSKPRKIIPSGEGETVEKLTKEQLEGAIAWKQGFMFKAWIPPYGQDDVINSRQPIPGVKYYTGFRSAYESLTQLKPGTLPAVMRRDMGIMDISVTTQKGKPQLRFVEDYRTKGRVRTRSAEVIPEVREV